MDLNSLTTTSGEWLRGSGPESDIVISSRVRLARNLAQFPFPNRAEESVRAEIESMLREKIQDLPVGKKVGYVNVRDLSDLDRQFLVERQLISREHAESRRSEEHTSELQSPT